MTDRLTDRQPDRQTDRGDLLDWVCGIEAAKSIVKVKVIVILKIRCVGFILIRICFSFPGCDGAMSQNGPPGFARLVNQDAPPP